MFIQFNSIQFGRLLVKSTAAIDFLLSSFLVVVDGKSISFNSNDNKNKRYSKTGAQCQPLAVAVEGDCDGGSQTGSRSLTAVTRPMNSFSSRTHSHIDRQSWARSPLPRATVAVARLKLFALMPLACYLQSSSSSVCIWAATTGPGIGKA